ncbi:MAG TPA: glycosyltransferase family 2 protein [Terriglobales bacterium]|nr:glycosyltransferase family 2 protein [Terriglobales bacterium]
MSTDLQTNRRRSGDVRLPGLSVVVPVFRSETLLPELVRRLGEVLPTLADQYEVVLVNDSSPDGSWDVISQLAQKHPWIHAINLMRNYGQHNALLCGIRATQYAIVVTMDDDLQHPPEEIQKLLAVLDQGYDVVYGTPAQEQHGMLRDLASFSTKLALQSVMGAEIARHVSAFRAFRAEVANAFAHYEGAFVSIDVLLTWGTNRFAATPVRHEARSQGTSGYTFRKLVTHAMNMMTGFSTKPLQIASLIGFFFTLFGFGVLLYVLIRYFLQGTPVPGFPFLASIVALFSGAQLFALGIMGEYLARMHFRSMQKPPYVVRVDAGRSTRQ